VILTICGLQPLDSDSQLFSHPISDLPLSVRHKKARHLVCFPSCSKGQKIAILETMDPVQHPLDWWAYGGYQEVIRHTGWNLAKARREVRRTIRAYGWNPIGRRGYEQLRQDIMDDRMLDHDLL